MDEAKIAISKMEYDKLRSNTTALFIIERAVRNDSEMYGYSSNTRAIVEAVLGISRNKEKAD